MKKSPKLIQKFKFWSDHPGTFMMNGSSHDLIRSDSIHFSIPTWSTWVFIFSYFSNIWNVSYCRTLMVSNIPQHLKVTITMVFYSGQIYYNYRTSKYKQILTNKSHCHEILKLLPPKDRRVHVYASKSAFWSILWFDRVVCPSWPISVFKNWVLVLIRVQWSSKNWSGRSSKFLLSWLQFPQFGKPSNEPRDLFKTEKVSRNHNS